MSQKKNRDWKAFKRSDLKLRVVRLYGEGYTPSRISLDLDMPYQTVQKYIAAWNKNRFGIAKEDLEAALKHYDRWDIDRKEWQ